MVKLLGNLRVQCSTGLISDQTWRQKLGHCTSRLRAAPVSVSLPRPRVHFQTYVKASSGAETTSSVNAAASTIAPHLAYPSALGEDVAVNWSSSEDSPSPEVIKLEEKIEKAIYHCRFMAFLGVAGSLLGSVICFLKGCTYIISSYIDQFGGGGKVTLMLIEATDLYLIGTVMLIFGMGLYELFISNLDMAKMFSCGSNLFGMFKLQERPGWLEIKSVNALKTKVGHVIVMALLVGILERSKKVTITSPGGLFCFAASILMSSSSLLLLSKLQTSK